MKKLLVSIIVMFALSAGTLFAADATASESPAPLVFILGPRVGGSYTLESAAAYSAAVSKTFPQGGSYIPANTLFGVNLEQRILLGSTQSHFAFQELISLGGLEQGIALPSLAVLVGYRDASGFEFGIGPFASLAGVSVIAGIGWTFSFSGVFVPVDISVTIPRSSAPATIALTTGFNFIMGTRK